MTFEEWWEINSEAAGQCVRKEEAEFIWNAALANDKICPHGDPLCPCPDGNICHYEGKNPMTPPAQAMKGTLSESTN